MLTQEEVRNKYKERLIRERQDWISKVTGIPTPVLSGFKNGKKELWQESLEKLNAYLDEK